MAKTILPPSDLSVKEYLEKFCIILYNGKSTLLMLDVEPGLVAIRRLAIEADVSEWWLTSGLGGSGSSR